jgi:hypothetical protein
MNATGLPCDGWWEEVGWGRQPMLALRLQFDARSISGSGHDIVGLFTFAGMIDEQGRVAMVKHYLGQHTVEYLGNYDGEGLMWGHWRIGPLRDKWLIRIKSTRTTDAEQTSIAELA